MFVCVCVHVCVWWWWWAGRWEPGQGQGVTGAHNPLKSEASLSECQQRAEAQPLGRNSKRIPLPGGEQVRTRQVRSSRDWGLVGFQGRQAGRQRKQRQVGLATELGRPGWSLSGSQREQTPSPECLGHTLYPAWAWHLDQAEPGRRQQGKETRNVGSLTNTKSTPATRTESCWSPSSFKIC